VTFNEKEKIRFFNTVQRLAHSNEQRMEMLQLTDIVKSRLRFYDINTMEKFTTKRNIADLLLIAMGKTRDK